MRARRELLHPLFNFNYLLQLFRGRAANFYGAAGVRAYPVTTVLPVAERYGIGTAKKALGRIKEVCK